MQQKVREWTEQTQDIFRVIFALGNQEVVVSVKLSRSPSALVLVHLLRFVKREV